MANMQVKNENSALRNPCLEMKINGERILALIDTGASTSLISNKLVSPQLENLKQCKSVVKDASGNRINIKGKLDFKICTPDGEIFEEMLIYEDKNKLNIDVILGMNVLKNAEISLKNKTVCFIEDLRKRNKSMNPVSVEITSREIVNKNELASNKLCVVDSGAMADKRVCESESAAARPQGRPPDQFNLHLLEELTLTPNAVTITKVRVNKSLNNKTLIIHNRELK